MKIKRSECVKLFEALGASVASTWSNPRLLSKMVRLPGLIGDDAQKLKGEARRILDDVLAAAKSDDGIQILDDTPTPYLGDSA